ncbi:MAG: glycosyltransferase family 4 protein [Bacteroides sp.]|nr:glycosyltransferase family 4 protein [Bacteroides sp.]MCM1095946.1 glycosyltransferase family 4 protein [Terasakiella sp.]
MERKILIIVENLPVPFDTRVWQEATTLAANGYTVSVICPKGKGYVADYEYLDGVHIYRHDLPAEGNGAVGYAREYFSALWSEYRLARRVYRERGFHVIHGCNPPDDIYMVASRFKSKGVDYVFDHHDICPELFEAKFGHTDGLLYKSQLWLERQTYRHCTFAFVTNESYRRIAIERDGMDPDKVYVLRSGPRLERLKILPPSPQIKRGKRFMVGYLGVIGQQEGIEYLLDAAKYLRDKGRDDIFWGIVGGGPHLEALRRKASQMGLDDIVEFTGRVPDDVMLAYLNTADVCVNPDEYNAMNDKSTMNKVLEYMALAKPLVQFDLTEGRYSAREASLYARRNDSADLAEKIASLLDDPAARERMGRYGRERITSELSWEHTSKVLLEAYDRYFRSRGL